MSPCNTGPKLCFVLAYSSHAKLLYVIKMLHMFFFFTMKNNFNYVILCSYVILSKHFKKNRYISLVHKAPGNFKMWYKYYVKDSMIF